MRTKIIGLVASAALMGAVVGGGIGYSLAPADDDVTLAEATAVIAEALGLDAGGGASDAGSLVDAQISR